MNVSDTHADYWRLKLHLQVHIPLGSKKTHKDGPDIEETALHIENLP